MAEHTPNNPTKRPSVPTGPSIPGEKPKSKPMRPMPAASTTKPGRMAPAGSSGVNPQGQSQTVHGGPKR